MASRDLKVTLLGDDKTSGAFGSAGSGASKFAAVGVAAMVAIAAAAVGAGTALFKIGSEFQSSYDKIRVGTGATGKTLDALKDDFRAVVRDVPADFKSASTAIADINTRLGLTGKPLQTVSKQFLELSRITGTDVAANIDSGTAALNSFSVEASQQPAVLDQIFRASQASGVAFGTLASELGSSGTQLRAVGFDITESTALIATLGKAGLSTSDIMPSLGKAMAVAAKDGKSAKEVFEETFAAIKGAPDDTAAAGVAVEVFGSKAGPKFAQMVREGKLSYADMMAVVQGGSDTIMQAGADTQNFAEKWQMFKNRVLLALEPVATRVFNAMGAGMDRLSAWWDQNGAAITASAKDVGAAISDVAQVALPALKAAFSVVSTAVKSLTGFMGDHKTTVGAVAVALGTAAAGAAVWAAVIGTVSAVTRTWAAVQAAMNFVLAANPIGLVILAVAALVAGLVFAYKNSETFRTIVNGAFDAVKRSVGDAVGAMITGFRGLLTVWLTVADGIISGAAAALGWIPGLGGKLKQANTAFDEMKTGILGTLDSAAQKAYGFGEKSGSNAAAGLKGKQGEAFSAGQQVANDMGRGLGAGSGGARAVGAAMGDGLVAGIDSRKDAAIAAAARVSGAAVQAMRKNLAVASPSKVTTQLGQMVGEGLAVGMDDKARAAAAAGRNLADSALGRLRSDLRDVGDLAGMQVGGTGYVNSRLAATSAPAVSGSRSLTVNINAGGETIDEDRLMVLLQRAERLAGI